MPLNWSPSNVSSEVSISFSSSTISACLKTVSTVLNCIQFPIHKVRGSGLRRISLLPLAHLQLKDYIHEGQNPGKTLSGFTCPGEKLKWSNQSIQKQRFESNKKLVKNEWMNQQDWMQGARKTVACPRLFDALFLVVLQFSYLYEYVFFRKCTIIFFNLVVADSLSHALNGLKNPPKFKEENWI